MSRKQCHRSLLLHMITYLSPKCLKSVGKWRKQTFSQNQDSDNPGQKSLGQHYNIHFFLWFLGSLLKQCIIFEMFLQFSVPPPYTKLKLGKNSEYTRPTLFVGWGEGLDRWELENTPETQKCPKTFGHDCRRNVSSSILMRVFPHTNNCLPP